MESLCVIHREKGKMSAVHPTERHFGHEDLVITKLLMEVCEKERGQSSLSFENFEIPPLETRINCISTNFRMHQQFLEIFATVARQP